MPTFTQFRTFVVSAILLLSGGVVHGDLLGELERTTSPLTVSRSGTVAFDAGTRFLHINGHPTRTVFDGSVRPHMATPASTLSIQAQILDAAGTTVQGAGNPDFQLYGAVDVTVTG